MLSGNCSRNEKDPGDNNEEVHRKLAVIASNDDLMSEILFRLPVKSLVRFKSVSKRWLSLISNPHFSRRRYPTSVSGLILSNVNYPLFDFVSLNGNATGIPFRSLSFIDDEKGIRNVNSCNGLFCCTSNYRMTEKGCRYYIFNPVTQQHTTLPKHRGGVDTIVVGMNLAFHPSNSPHYKVVCVWRSIKSYGTYQIEIYSSETGSWRPSGDPFNYSNDLNFYSAVYWNGAIHWVNTWGNSYLYFDIEREILGTMPMPLIPEGWNMRAIKYFGESQGHLHLIEIYDPPATPPATPPSMQFDVLEMENNYSKWFVKYRVNLDLLPTTYPEMLRKYKPLEFDRYVFSILCLVRGEKEEDSSSLVLHIPGKVISYNLKDKTFKKLLLQPGLLGIEDPSQFGCYVAHQYIKTVSCV